MLQPQTTKSKSWIFALSLITCIGWINLSYIFTLFNEAGEQAYESLGWSDLEKEKYGPISSSIITLTGAIGILVAGVLFPTMSRRRSFIITDILNITGSLMTMSSYIPLFILGRALMGLGNGLTAAMVPIYVREMAPPEISGRIGSINKICFSIGLVLSFGLGLGLPLKPERDNLYWRLLFLMPAILSSIRMPFFLFVYKFDSAKYYVLHDQFNEARGVLEKVYKPDFQEKGLTDIVEQKKHEGDSSLKIIFQRYKKQLFAGLIVIIMQDMTGLPAINFYSTEIMLGSSKKEGDEIQSARLVNFGMGVLRVFAASTAGILLDKLGRRTMYLWGNCLIITSLIFLGFSLDNEIPSLARIMVLVFALGNSLSFALINPCYLPEILPVKAVSFLLVIDSFEIFTVVTFFKSVHQAIGMGNSIYIFAIVAVLGHVMTFLYIKETKGLTINQVYLLYTDKNSFLKNIAETKLSMQAINYDPNTTQESDDRLSEKLLSVDESY